MIKQSILKRPTTAYLSVDDPQNSEFDRANSGALSLKFSPANSTQNSQKNVRFSGIDLKSNSSNNSNNINASYNAPTLQPRIQQRQHRQQQNNAQLNDTNKDDYFELEKTQFPSEVGIKKYYKKSKTVPCKQIKLVGLNDEFIVASQPIQRHIQRELIQQQQAQQQQQQRSNTSGKTRAQLRTTSARPFSDNHNRSLMYPNVFRMAPSPSNYSSKSSNISTANTLNNSSLINVPYEQQNSGALSSYSSPNRSGQYSYYHWQGSEPSRSPNCENVSVASAATSTQLNTNSLTNQHTKLINTTINHQTPQYTVGQLKSPLVRYSTKKTRNKSNLNLLFSPTSSTQSYSTYQTASASNTSENGALDTSNISNTTLNGSASQFAQQLTSQPYQALGATAQTQAETSRSKTPSSLTLYTYLLDSNKTNSKEAKSSVIRTQSKKINYEQVYMKNLVPKIQKLDVKNNTANPSLTGQTNSGHVSAHFRQSINPIHESPSNFSGKVNYKIFADKPEKRLTNGLQDMKLIRNESASS